MKLTKLWTTFAAILLAAAITGLPASKAQVPDDNAPPSGDKTASADGFILLLREEPYHFADGRVGKERYWEKVTNKGVSVGRHGRRQAWNADGVLVEEDWCFDNVLHGPSTVWYKDGSRATREFVEGMWHGDSRMWWANGILRNSSAFVMNKPDGVEQSWYENGKMRHEISYEMGKRSGSSMYWYENGMMKQRTHYEDDKRQGLEVKWHENGEKSQMGEWDKDTQVGVWKYWDEEGKLIRTDDYGKPKDSDD